MEAELARTRERVPFLEGVLAAPPVRCRQTVAPLAQRLRLPIDIEPAFADATFAHEPEATQAAAKR